MKYVEITYRYEDRPPHLHASPVDATEARARLDDGNRALQASLAKTPGIRAAYGAYLIDSREVWAPRAGSSMCAGLAEPPRDAAQFSRFGDEVVRSQRIVAMLER